MEPTRAGIGVKHGNALLASGVLEEALLGAVGRGTGQTREVDEDGDLLGLGLWGQVEVEVHLAASGGGIVAKLEQLAAERSDSGLGGDRHGWRRTLEGTGNLPGKQNIR